MSMECWRDIYYFDYRTNEWVDYRGLYQVSNYGRVRSLNYNNTGKTHLMKGTKARGHLHVTLSKDKKSKKKYVHQLVAHMFVSNPNKYYIVNHKDENPENNIWTNLEWCDNSYNLVYGTINKRKSITRNNGNKGMTAIEQYSIEGELVAEYKSQRLCTRTMKENDKSFSQGTLWSCLNGKMKTYKGFIWKYKDNKG